MIPGGGFCDITNYIVDKLNNYITIKIKKYGDKNEFYKNIK